MTLPIYLVEYLGLPRNHHALFIRLDENTEEGELYHVAGDVQNAKTIAMLKSHGVLVSEDSVGNAAQPGSSRSVGRTYGQSSTQSSQARSSSSSQPVDGQTSSDGYWTFSSKYGDHYHVGKEGRKLWASQQRAR
ncbi:kinase domain containing protein [Fusarium agapanthi]|uniref:Kinase domain containing protein n=1 Tax=Fusarium agapanthi TaxID=1803897 RepID=A0A9P5BAL6_9HYPO|nr:kinase domain containing protein [Fusarium agapanthi]